MKKLAVALWFVFSCSTSHAQECTASADQYTGILVDDGRCFPWPKGKEKFSQTVGPARLNSKAGWKSPRCLRL